MIRNATNFHSRGRISLQVTIIGGGYVGLTTSVALAYIGHRVHCIDQDEGKIIALQNGIVPIHEAGVAELLTEVSSRISFGTWDSFSQESDVVVIAVGTPRKSNGDADLTYVESVAGEIGRRLLGDKIPVIVNKSTVPIGSARRVESIVSHQLGERGNEARVSVASNPEFLREGVALFDTFYPDRIVVGAEDSNTVKILREMYAAIIDQSFRTPECLPPRPGDYVRPAFIVTSPTSAEIIKYAANTFLSLKISFINEIAGLAEKVGADIMEVARGIGMDRRIGAEYLKAGIGWGGSCFGKDVQAIIHTGSQYGCDMLLSRAAVQVNLCQREEVIKKLQSALKVIRGSNIGLLGLSFKPGTDDLRDAPSITIASRLLELGAYVKAYDPVAMENCCRSFPDLDIRYTSGPEELARGVDAIILVTEWEEFRTIPFARLGELMRQRIIIDGRNALNCQELTDLGFRYLAIGR